MKMKAPKKSSKKRPKAKVKVQGGGKAMKALKGQKQPPKAVKKMGSVPGLLGLGLGALGLASMWKAQENRAKEKQEENMAKRSAKMKDKKKKRKAVTRKVKGY